MLSIKLSQHFKSLDYYFRGIQMMHESDPIVGEVKGLSMFIRYTAMWLC